MSFETRQPTTDPVRVFVESTRNLTESLDDLETSELSLSVQRQLDSFEALAAAISAGALPHTTRLAEAIDSGQSALDLARKRMHDIRGELEGLRTARTRASERRGSDATAKFISRRV